jgi:uncharacterized protein involved in exopolysaccharide biosynthesis
MTTQPPPRPFLRILRRRWWLLLLLPLVTAAAVIAVAGTSGPEYMASEQLQINVVDPQEVPLFSQSRYTASSEQVQSVHDEFYDVIRLPSVAWRTIADLGLDLAAAELIERIDSQHQFDFVTVTARMPTPELAQKVVSAQVENALDAYRTIRSTPAQTSRDFIEAQLTQQSQTLAAADEALQDFQLKNEVSDLERETLAYQDLLRSLRAARDAAQVEAARNDRLAAEYRTLAGQTQKQLDALQPNQETASAAPTPAATPAPALAAEIETLQAQAQRQRAAANDYAAAAAGHRAAIAEYDRQLSERQQQLIYLLGLQERYRSLVNRLARAQATYDFLADKADEARLKLMQGSNVGYLQVVDPAQLPDQALPSRTWQLLLVGVLISLVAAISLAFVLEALESSLGRPAPVAPAVARQP